MVGNLVCMKDGEQVFCLALKLVERTVNVGVVRSAEWVVQWDCLMEFNIGMLVVSIGILLVCHDILK